MDFDFKRDVLHTVLAIVLAFGSLALSMWEQLRQWRRLGRLAKMMTAHGRPAKREDFRRWP